MDRRQRAALFRTRLRQVLDEKGLSQSGLAREAGLDRSTVSQLLRLDDPRLPQGGALAAIAEALGESADWLLGLSGQREGVLEILERAVEVTETTPDPLDENILRWFEQAAGYKVRNVPTTLPALLKTQAVLDHEYRDVPNRTPTQAAAATAARLDFARLAASDLEICLPRHRLLDLAEGGGVWRGLDAAARRDQIVRMAELCEELYPSLRVYLYDQRSHYAPPFIVFGPQRAAIYLGQRYLGLSLTRHIQLLTRHFDGLVRGAVVQAHVTPAFLKGLL